MKLISMTEFVLQFDKPVGYFENESDFLYSQVDYMGKVLNYAKFLQQPLILGMFVPCDEKGNALEEPTQEKYGWHSATSPEEESGWMYEEGEAKYYEALEQWNKAKEKVLFEGYFKEFNAIRSPEGGYLHVEGLKGKTIETIIGSNLELTPSALKSIGL